MQVLLLDVAGFALEGGVARVVVDEDVARNDAHAGAVGEAVEEGCFAGSGDALVITLAFVSAKGAGTYHQSCHGTGFNPPGNVV